VRNKVVEFTKSTTGSLELTPPPFTRLLIIVLKALRILSKKVLFGDKINNIAYTTKAPLFRIKIKRFRQLYKGSVVVSSIV